MTKSTYKILFIGNSHTYYNDMAYMLQYLSEQSDSSHRIEPVMIAHPGKSLGEHKVEPEIRFNILYGNYDFIVLQQVAHPFKGGKEALIRDGKEIYEFIKQTQATPITYMTWAEKDKPENQKPMTEAYIEFAKEIHGLLCPVGMAWQNAIASNPDLELYDADYEHANPVGSYLVACTFYSAILKKSPLGLPNVIKVNGKVLHEIPAKEAEFIQKVVWNTVTGIGK
ncbi:DUF4886 domain-containing protein [Clostridium oryzae]|uniref:SGNH hydrolase-type esterase domain-containing protein n=1 Tax=Clostridium oryzae TaxID=1450648 RepID=A0A1V4ICC5_9CLOT|nr:DUF4886 domain-containing protein [Clostridium oryzae]OPJ57583.1 hypothetical protein CLORY_40400 [Clostridium oryzae]